MDTRRIGTLGERIAELFLVLKGYRILQRNFRYAGREIDLLAQRQDTVIAVEVKLRRGTRFGSAIEAVDGRKLKRIQLALEAALRQRDRPFRPQVDLIVIDVDEGMGEMNLRHIEAVY